MNLKSILLLFCIALSSVAYSQEAQNNYKVSTSEGDEIDFINPNRKEISRATNHARDTFDDFLELWQENKNNPDYKSFYVKVSFDSPQYTREHMWVGSLKQDENGDLVGILSNTPLDKAIKVKEGDEVVIDKEKMSDWMYVQVIDGKEERISSASSLPKVEESESTDEKNSNNKVNVSFY